MLAVNSLIQEALELTSMVGDGEAAEGTLAASALALLNRTVARLNNDDYFSSTIDYRDINASGEIVFHKLEEGEDLAPGTVDMEPPESIEGVSRKLGIRWIELLGSNPRDQMARKSYSLADTYSYGVTDEEAPSGERRLVGRILLNGTANSQFRVFMNRRLPVYELTDVMSISPLYHDALLYSLAVAICEKYKLYDYKPEMERQKAAALAVIDRNTLNNRFMNEGYHAGSYMDAYYDGLGGNGLHL
jgi:hypothetical protein